MILVSGNACCISKSGEAVSRIVRSGPGLHSGGITVGDQ